MLILVSKLPAYCVRGELQRLPVSWQAKAFMSLPQVELVEWAATLPLDNTHNNRHEELQIMSLHRALTLHNQPSPSDA